MISRRASHKLVDGRHAYCHVVIHRTEQRKDSRQRTHSVYLVRLLAHIGEFPSPDTFYELRYSSLERLHQQLRASRPRLRLPELPRARRLGNQHPSYAEQMSAALQDYLRRLLEGWLRLYAEFDGFIMLMHAVHAAQQAEEPLEPCAAAAAARRRGADRAGGRRRRPRRTATAAAAWTARVDAAPLLSGDASAAYGEFLGWSHYVEYSEQLLLAAGGGNVEANPFEAEAALDEGLHVWIVADFSVVRLAATSGGPPSSAPRRTLPAPVAARTRRRLAARWSPRQSDRGVRRRRRAAVARALLDRE